jgi:hypothetical protein
MLSNVTNIFSNQNEGQEMSLFFSEVVLPVREKEYFCTLKIKVLYR